MMAFDLVFRGGGIFFGKKCHKIADHASFARSLTWGGVWMMAREEVDEPQDTFVNMRT